MQLKSLCGNRTDRLMVTLVIVLFAVLYALVSIGNHINMRTYALDLGVYTHALYDYAHGSSADCGVFAWPDQNSNLLHDHFDLYLPLLSPLVYLFGSYTLLIVQIAALLFGGWGVFRLVRRWIPEGCVPLCAMVAYLGFFGVWHAVGYDYHSNVVAVNLLPWFLLLFEKRRYLWALALMLLMCVAKESMALWLVCVMVALMVEYRRDAASWRWLGVYGILAAVYFVVISMVVMPSMGGPSLGFWRYSHMGDSMGELALSFFTQPGEALRVFFTNFNHDPSLNGVKMEFYLCCIASGMWLLLRKPHFLLMMVPPLLLKMMSRDAGFWGVEYQYNVEFAPILALGASRVFADWQHSKNEMIRRWTVPIAVSMTLLTVFTTIYTTSNPRSCIRKDNVRILKSNHFIQTEFDKEYAKTLMAKIPSEASVSAASPFVPHLALRDEITMFPVMAYQAEYLLVFADHWSYYDDARAEISKMLSKPEQYEVMATDGNIYLIHNLEASRR